MSTARLDLLRAVLDEAGLDGLWVTSPVDDIFHRHSQNRRYLTGFTGSTGSALVTRDHAVLAVDPRYTEQARRETAGRGFEVREFKSGLRRWLPELAADLGLHDARIGVSAADISLEAFEALREAIEDTEPDQPRPRLEPAAGVIEPLRAIKDDEELALLQRAIDIGDAVATEVLAAVEPGDTERQVAENVARGARRLGADEIAFGTIAAGGPWGALPHATPRDEPLRAGEPLVLDMGVSVQGYASDLTRTIPVGGHPDARFRETYELVLEAQQAAIERAEPGMTGQDLHQVALDVFARRGLGDNFVHGLGHGIGLAVHEDPHIGRTSDDLIQAGMVFTIEPGLYFPDWGGVRIEDIVVLEPDGARVLSHAPKLTFAGATA